MIAAERPDDGRRSAAKEQAWRELFQAQARSGLPVTKFCRERGVTTSAFYFWRSEIARRDAERRTSTRNVNPTAGFVELAATEAVVRHDVAPISIVMEQVPRIEVSPGFDPQSLRDIFVALRDAVVVLRDASC